MKVAPHVFEQKLSLTPGIAVHISNVNSNNFNLYEETRGLGSRTTVIFKPSPKHIPDNMPCRANVGQHWSNEACYLGLLLLNIHIGCSLYQHVFMSNYMYTTLLLFIYSLC